MTPQERQLVDDLFSRLAGLENAPRDPDALAAISQGLRIAPNAIYALVQTVLLQDEALKRANAHIQQLEQAAPAESGQPGGFLDTMRDAVFGQNQPRSSVPNVRPPEPASRPAWNTGQVLPQQGQYGQYAGPGAQQQQPAPPAGGGGSFLGTAAAAAAGMVGGSLLLGSIRSMMGGSQQGFGDSGSLSGGSRNPWSANQSGGDLARDAGLNDIGSGGQRAGAFDQAQADADQDQDQDQDDEDDVAMGHDDDGFDDGDSDYA